MESLSVAFWGCFLGHNITPVFVKVSLLWGTSWGGRQSSWVWGSWILGLVWREIIGGCDWTGSLSLSQPCHGWVMQCLKCPVELRDASRCWEKEKVFWLSCLWSWWWK